MNARITLMLIILGCSPSAAWANLRAPGVVPAGPSTTLQEPVSGLTVRSEKLVFACEPGACSVRASYVVAAEEEVEIATSFILPTNSTVKYSVNDDAGTITPAPLKPDDVPDGLPAGAPGLFEAELTGTLQDGLNELIFSYDQPLTRYEAAYGYFTKSRWTETLTYEMWPLREWTLADDFEMAVTVSFHSPREGWWKRTFGTVKTMECTGAAEHAVSATRKKERLVVMTDFDDSFPDRFQCTWGDQDLVGNQPT